MFASVTGRRFQVTDLVVASVGAVTTLAVSVAITSGGLVLGDAVIVTPRSALTNGIAIYGHVVDATHFAIDFVNASAGAIDPADTFDFDVFILTNTGALST
jgi:hypothetical protein